MAIKNQQLNIVYTSWNISTNLPVSGDQANHSIYISKDGSAFSSVTNSPTNLGYGEYSLLLTATEMNSNFIKITGESTTSNVVIIPIIIITESGILTDIKNNTITIDTIVDSIQVDTNSIESKIDTIDTVVDTIDTVVDSIQIDTNSIESKIDTIDTVVDSIQVDTNSIESKIDTIDTVVDTIDTVVDSIQVNTNRLDNLIENVSGDRFTSKALEQAPSSSSGGDATEANQLDIIDHLTDIKGTGFVKDTNSLTNLSSSSATNLSVDATIIQV